MNTRITALALAAAATAFSGTASAQIKTWTFSDGSDPGACAITTAGGTGGAGNVRSCRDQATSAPTAYSVDIRGFGATNVNTNASGGTTTPVAGIFGTTTNTFSAGTVIDHGTGFGLGVGSFVGGESGSTTSSTNGNHATDSADGATDMLLLSFTTAQVLRTVTIGWSGSDGDFQVLRWTGGGTVTSVAGKSASTLLGEGWQLVTTVDAAGGIATPDFVANVNAGLLSSSSWLITAYNSSFGTGGSAGADAIKVVGVTAGIATVSAPGTLALAGMGLLGAAFLRRRNAA